MVFMFCKCTCSGLIGILAQAQVMILWGFLNTFIKFLSTGRVWTGGSVGTLILKIIFCYRCVLYNPLGVCSRKINIISAEWGRHGSPRAHTLGKRSHGLQEGFQIPLGPPGHPIFIKNRMNSAKILKL